MTYMNPLLLVDSYKVHHQRQYPEGMTKLYSNLTPRKSRIEGIDGVVVFGIQHFALEYLIEAFNNYFFYSHLRQEVDEERVEVLLADVKTLVIKEYQRHCPVDTAHIEALWDLGYLPIELKALPEGTICPIGVPCLTITNTHPDFGWLVNYLETLLSCMLWQPITSATIAHHFRKLLDKYAIETTGTTEGVQWQGHDFSMRGMSSPESAILSGMGHLLSFTGTDTIPAIYQLERSYEATGLIGASVPACYDDLTEILTDKGWKFFKDLDKTELVAQYEDGGITFVKPLDYFEDRYKGKMIQFSKSKGYKYVDALVTPNHRMVRINEGTIDMFEAGDFSYRNRNGYSHRSNVIISGLVVNSSDKELSNLDRLKIAFQADGSFPSHAEDYTGLKGKGFPIRFSLKKERKKERLEYLLKSENIEYTLSKYDNGYYSFWVNVPEPFVKDFSWVNIADMNYMQCIDFIDELSHWDGSMKNNCIVYSSTNIQCIDVIQAIAAISGHKTQFNEYNDPREDYDRLPLYSLTIQTRKTCISGNNVIRGEVDYDGYVYCVSVPSKMIVVRRNNVVLVCGNTEHSVMCMGTKEEEVKTFERLLNLYPEGILSVVSDTWDLWKVCTEFLPQLKEQILSRNGKLVIRPDSGDPVDIICGKDIPTFDNPAQASAHFMFNVNRNLFFRMKGWYKVVTHGGKNFEYMPYNPVPEDKGVIELLWDVFGGTVNEQGYKVLDSHIGAIYGDSINPERAKAICERLKAKGFASTNIVFGIGSYAYQYNTRDTFGFAMKATYGEITHGNNDPDKGPVTSHGYVECRNIFKDPITDDGTKRSKKGLLSVQYDPELLKQDIQKIIVVDQVGWGDESSNNLLETVFKDGKMIRKETLEEIRERLAQYR